MIAHLTLAGAIHSALALLCIVVGLIQFLRPKRGVGHRARGYLYVYGMLVADGTAMLIYRFSGHLNLFHIGAIGNFLCIVLAVVPLLRSPRPANWRLTHYYFIAWSYVSLMSAAAATEIVVRLAPPMTRGQIGWAAFVLSIVTMSTAYVLIGKNRPPAEATPASGKLAEQSGVPS
jgi:Ca2+/Na+ antiporter